MILALHVKYPVRKDVNPLFKYKTHIYIAKPMRLPCMNTWRHLIYMVPRLSVVISFQYAFSYLINYTRDPRTHVCDIIFIHRTHTDDDCIFSCNVFTV